MKMRNEGKTINGVDYDQKLRDDNPNIQLNEQVNNKLKTVTHTPKDKWNTPQTTAQEIGWMTEVAVSIFRSSNRKIKDLCTGERAAQKLTTPIVSTP